MTAHQLLGRLSGLQRMLVELTESLPEPACYQSPHPELAPVAWYLGRAVYLETYWLREVVQGDDDITARVRALFTPGAMPAEQQWQSLPPKDHLLNWALELQEENLTLLANPSMLPTHILMQEERLLLLIYAALGEIYEQMIRVVTEQQLGQQPHYRVTAPLRGVTPVADAVGISQGHYRIGARNDPASADNEQPAQAVELSSYQIDRVPVSNTFYLGFMEAGGYQQHSIWSPEGWHWRQNGIESPHHWRRDDRGSWYGTGVNGPFDLIADDPVSGISRYEAEAYANWVASLGGSNEGAVLQHEYQWEVAARNQSIREYGRVWEWCANPFTPYSDYRQPELSEARTREFDDRHYTLRGASLHSQPLQRRISYRHRALPGARSQFAGMRLVYPPQ